MGSLWAQLLLQFYTDLFESVFLSWSEDVHVVWGYPPIILLFPLFRPGLITIRIDTLWKQLLLQFSIDHFETMHTCSTQSENVHVVLGLSSYYFFYQLFPLFRLSFFPAPISIRIDILWAQLSLDFSTDHLETMHTCST